MVTLNRFLDPATIFAASKSLDPNCWDVRDGGLERDIFLYFLFWRVTATRAQGPTPTFHPTLPAGGFFRPAIGRLPLAARFQLWAAQGGI